MSALPGTTDSKNGDRRSSFNFLRRQKSNETAANRRNMNKKGQKGYPPQQQAVPRVPPQLPSHPQFETNSIGTALGVDPGRPDSYTLATNHRGASMPYGSSPPHGVRVPPIPSSSPGSKNGDYVDPYARTESMTHRGRYSYASSAISTTTGINSPRRVRRRKDPTPFNILVMGVKNSGKTSFIDFLRSSLAPPRGKREKTPSPPRTAVGVDSAFTPHYLETEFDHERIGVTLWDSQGLEKKFVDLQLREMSSFLESKFEETFTEEQKVVRAPGVRDTHIHCVFMLLDPLRLDANLAHSRKPYQPTSKFDEALRLMGILDEDLDLQVLKTLQGKTTVIPVISKADTITTSHMALLKKAVWDSLKQAKCDPLEALQFAEADEEDQDDDRLDERDEDAYNHSVDDHEQSEIIDKLVDRSSSDYEEEAAGQKSTPPTSPPKANHQRSASNMTGAINSTTDKDETPYLPMSIISPDSYEPGVVGRRFPWGFADPYNVEHCDFVRLKDSVFSEWRGELREASREVWYEGWRTSRLKKRERTTTSHGPGASTPARLTSAGGQQSQYRSPSGPGPQQGSPEVMRGAYRQGVNAY